MELNDYFLAFRRNSLLILTMALLMTGVSAVWSLSATPQYQASTQLFVSVRTGDSSAGELTQGSAFARQAVTSYVSVVNSSIVMDRVVSELDLETTSEELSEKVTAESPAETVLINIEVHGSRS